MPAKFMGGEKKNGRGGEGPNGERAAALNTEHFSYSDDLTNFN